MNRLKLFGITAGAILLIAGACRGSLDITLAWEPSLTDINGQPLAEAPGYKLYFSNFSGEYDQCLDTGTSTVVHVTGLEYNKPYFFIVMACTANGESAYSEELEWDSPVMPDGDADGISDDWELENFDALGSANNLTDYDGEGSSDQVEFLAGTSPTDPRDYPALAIQTEPAGAALSFEAKQASGPGYENRARYYTLMQCNDLAAGIWTSVPGQENLPASNQTVRVVIARDKKRAFFRLDSRLD
jgi:hypothetical protein